MDNNQLLLLIDSVRKRPAMYIGNDGIVGMMDKLIYDCIAVCKTDNIKFEIVIINDFNFTFTLETLHDKKQFLNSFYSEEFQQNYFPQVLKIISENFEQRTRGPIRTEIHFTIDKNVITDTKADYLKLIAKIYQVAVLHPNCEIITIDQRTPIQSQNYFHIPDGIFHLFEKEIQKALGIPKLKFTYAGEINGNSYKIALAFRTDWFPNPVILSFANDVHTDEGGSLVDGILDGLVLACKSYAKENNVQNRKITRNKIFNGLILVCSVRGPEFKYGGSCKQTLEDNSIRKDVKKLVAGLISELYRNNKDASDKLFKRFDQSLLPTLHP